MSKKLEIIIIYAVYIILIRSDNCIGIQSNNIYMTLEEEYGFLTVVVDRSTEHNK
jgi:hypothetical protein